jgi:anti-sigma regulatory factor (Ser/Thr protein kinase)
MIWPADDPNLSMWRLSDDLTAAREARLSIRTWLSSLLNGEPNGPLSDCIIMSASELAANAVVHGTGPVFLTARVDYSSGYVPVIVVTVTDGGPSVVSPVGSVPAGESGRGLFIVEALADWTEVDRTWNATQVRAGFAAAALSVPRPRQVLQSAPSSTDLNGTRPGCPPNAPLSALI